MGAGRRRNWMRAAALHWPRAAAELKGVELFPANRRSVVRDQQGRAVSAGARTGCRRAPVPCLMLLLIFGLLPRTRCPLANGPLLVFGLMHEALLARDVKREAPFLCRSPGA